MTEETTAPPITYGDPITESSIATYPSLGGFPSTRWIDMSPLILSRDGSRRIVKVGPNADVYQHHPVPGIRDQAADLWGRYPAVGGVPPGGADDSQGAGAGVGALESRESQNGRPEGSVHGRTLCALPRQYPDYRAIQDAGQPHPSRPGGSCRACEDLRWVGRVLAQPLRVPNHLRQQVVSRLVDGILLYGWAEMSRVALAARPAQSDAWKGETTLSADLVRMAVGPLIGDPALWARVLARNIDVDAFRIRLDAGQVPGVDTRATPWGPTAETLISTTPTGDVNEKKVAVAEWHEAHQRNTEDVILKYHDSEMQRPIEEHDGYEDEHEHDPLA